MASRARQAVGPLYLFLCLLLGGSAQGIWANMALQLLGVAIIAWAAVDKPQDGIRRPARKLLLLVILLIALVAIQMIPLPSSWTAHLRGREIIATGNQILGLDHPWQSLSLTPYRSFDSLLALIPPLALFCAIAALDAYRRRWLVAALIAGTLTGILLGALQVSSVGDAWYLYPESSFGIATGFFANGNHMATLLVTSVPFLAAALASARGSNHQRRFAILVTAAGALFLVFVGIVLNRSLAGYGMTPPVLAASALIVMPQRSRARPWAMLVATLLLIGAVAALATSSVRSGQFGNEAATSVQSRHEMLSTSLRAAGDFMPWGSGLGSFRAVYQLYEDPAAVDDIYVGHAHNDYVEVAIEAGLPGILLMIAFMVWWVRACWRAWVSADAGPYARAASIASSAILVHSIVDFPLRTAAIAAVFAMCLGLLVERRAASVRSASDLRPTRHVVVR